MTAFSQRDPRWAQDLLGTSFLTLGQAGCLVTAAAAMCADFGIGTDPGRLNKWLTMTGGFVADNLFVFNALSGLGLDCGDVIFCRDEPAPVDVLTELLIAGNCGVVVEVDFTPGGALNSHWVQLLTNAATPLIMDPWQLPGHELIALDQYFAPGWDLARGLFALAWYMPAKQRRFWTPVTRRWHQRQLAQRRALE